MGADGSTITVPRGSSTMNFVGVSAVAAGDSNANDVLLINGAILPLITFTSAGGNDAIEVALGGRVTFASDLSPTLANVSVFIDAGAVGTFNTTQHLNNLTVNGASAIVNGGDKVLVVKSIAVGGQLDLKDDDLIIDYSGASPAGTWSGNAYSGVTGLIASGRNGGAWNGNGILSSLTNGPLRSFGVAEASQALGIAGVQTGVFDGQTVDSSAILVKFTYGGDANLDGKIDVLDYGNIDLNVPLGTNGWFNGDFNYDGKIDVLDYGIIDFNIGIQGAPL
jgi:hypothetical protein